MAHSLNHCCGVFGITGHSEAGRLAYLGLYALQHRGQESSGIATSNLGAMFVERGMGQVAEVFDTEHLDRMPGRAAIGHVRYSTAGASNLANAQPVRIESRRGSIALGHNGNLVNAKRIREQLEQEGSIFNSTSDTEVMLHLFARSQHDDVVDALADALGQVEGAFSMTLLTNQTLDRRARPAWFSAVVDRSHRWRRGARLGNLCFRSDRCRADSRHRARGARGDPG